MVTIILQMKRESPTKINEPNQIKSKPNKNQPKPNINKNPRQLKQFDLNVDATIDRQYIFESSKLLSSKVLT